MPYPSKHWNSGPFVYTLEFLSYPPKRLNSGPFFYTPRFSDVILQNLGILALFL